jgi:hypothetical protein
MLDTQWSLQGVQTERGTTLDLRYEHINQNRVQNGTRRIAVGEIPGDHDEVSSLNRNWVATLDHTFNGTWGVTVSLPYVHREHLHFDNATGVPVPETWDFSRAGDVRVLGRYQLTPTESAEHALTQTGIYFGAKLPTGDFRVANSDGTVAERSLQPGTGTTDVLLGGFLRRAIPLKNLSWFAQGLLQAPLHAREDFRPGVRLSFDAGLRYEAGEHLGLLLQMNALARGRDSGGQGETDDSGGRSVFLSPGLSYAFARNIQAYSFLQVPIYQNVNGVQLVASHAVVVGLSARF